MGQNPTWRVCFVEFDGVDNSIQAKSAVSYYILLVNIICKICKSQELEKVFCDVGVLSSERSFIGAFYSQRVFCPEGFLARRRFEQLYSPREVAYNK